MEQEITRSIQDLPGNDPGIFVSVTEQKCPPPPHLQLLAHVFKQIINSHKQRHPPRQIVKGLQGFLNSFQIVFNVK